MIEIPTFDVITPFAQDLRLVCPINAGSYNRGDLSYSITGSGVTQIILPWTPVSSAWVEVYVDDNRLLNPRLNSQLGAGAFENFNVTGNRIDFAIPHSGTIKVVCDSTPNIDSGGLIIPIKNIQGAHSVRASLYFEPVILTQPKFGYARLSTDRESMVYVPQTGFIGYDAFSYCIINNRGQHSRNRCVNISVK